MPSGLHRAQPLYSNHGQKERDVRIPSDDAGTGGVTRSRIFADEQAWSAMSCARVAD